MSKPKMPLPAVQASTALLKSQPRRIEPDVEAGREVVMAGRSRPAQEMSDVGEATVGSGTRENLLDRGLDDLFLLERREVATRRAVEPEIEEIR